MPEVRVVQPHQLTPAEAKARLASFQDLLAKYRVKLDWSGQRATIGGVPGVGGSVEVRPAEVAVVVTLSRMITAVGIDPKRLEDSIRRRLSEAFAQGA